MSKIKMGDTDYVAFRYPSWVAVVVVLVGLVIGYFSRGYLLIYPIEIIFQIISKAYSTGLTSLSSPDMFTLIIFFIIIIIFLFLASKMVTVLGYILLLIGSIMLGVFLYVLINSDFVQERLPFIMSMSNLIQYLGG